MVRQCKAKERAHRIVKLAVPCALATLWMRLSYFARTRASNEMRKDDAYLERVKVLLSRRLTSVLSAHKVSRPVTVPPAFIILISMPVGSSDVQRTEQYPRAGPETQACSCSQPIYLDIVA